MQIYQPGLYHIYNRGNNQQKIFFNEGNYDYFLRKCHQYLKPVTEVLAWCLMTNHFHFLIEATEKSIEKIQSGGIIMPAISNGFRLLQSSYAKGINRQENRTGNLFQQKTKAKFVSDEDNYARTAFLYIHQNPLKAGLVTSPADWPYSSWKDYMVDNQDGLCNVQRGKDILNLNEIDLTAEASMEITEEKLKKIL